MFIVLIYRNCALYPFPAGTKQEMAALLLSRDAGSDCADEWDGDNQRTIYTVNIIVTRMNIHL